MNADIFQAATALAQLWRFRPDCSCALAWQDFAFSTDEEFVDGYVDGLRKAGLPK